LTQPRAALEAAGFRTELVAPGGERVESWDSEDRSERLPADRRLEDASPEDYDGLLLPGGVRNPDKLRLDKSAIAFVRAFVTGDKPVAAICHAPWLLAEADVVAGRRLTSWPSLRTDLENAGAVWVDEPVVEDGWLVTSRKPADIPAFSERAIALFRASLQAPTA
jgi:protease I